MEGPAFSTKAESQLYKSWGMDVIGMTSLAEAKLAREAEICFSAIAIVTDYDAWHDDIEAVSTQAVIENFNKAVGTARKLVSNALERFTLPRECDCGQALENALFTDLTQLDKETKDRFGTLLDKYVQ
jgi:5'-methylthioadenosine phosphorylase